MVPNPSTSSSRNSTAGALRLVPFTKQSLIRHDLKCLSRPPQALSQKLLPECEKVRLVNGQHVPKRFFNMPLEDASQFGIDKTFCVLIKRSSSYYLYRFSAEDSLFIWTPWSPLRRFAIRISCHRYFELFVMTTILLNCVFLALSQPIEETEYVFLAIYTAEMIIKIIAKGFVLKRYTYLRKPWNWLDFVVVLSGYLTIGLQAIGVAIGNLAGLRTFRVLRAFKTVSITPGLKTIVNAMLHSLRMLAEVMTLTVFCLMVFALLALQLYVGTLRQKCVRYMNTTDIHNGTSDQYAFHVNNRSSWLLEADGQPALCGNKSGARHCPANFTCLPDVGDNPNYGFTNFDAYGWSLLTTFQLITLDYWEDLYNKINATTGPTSSFFFMLVIFFGSFYLINLTLAVVAIAYQEEAQTTLMERDKVKKFSTTLPTKLTTTLAALKFKSVFKHKENAERWCTPRRNPRLNQVTHFSPQVTARHTTQDFGSSAVHRPPREVLDEELERCETPACHPMYVGPAPDIVVSTGGKLPSRRDDNITVYLGSPSAVRLSASMESSMNCRSAIGRSGVSPPRQTPWSWCTLRMRYCFMNCTHYTRLFIRGMKRLRVGLARVVSDSLFDLAITVCILLNTAFLAAEHHGMTSRTERILRLGNLVFTMIFTLEAFVKMLTLGRKYFQSKWNVFDLVVVVFSLMDLSFETVGGLSVLRTFRLLRVVKLAQAWSTMRLLLTIIGSTLGAVGNMTLVLAVIVYIFAILGVQLFSDVYTAENFAPDPLPRWNFTDFWHSLLMMFRILCGEWMEPLWDCMRVAGEKRQVCVVLFLLVLTVGNFLVLNLFLAMLLNSFNSQELEEKKAKDESETRFTRTVRKLRCFLKGKKNAVSAANEHESASESPTDSTRPSRDCDTPHRRWSEPDLSKARAHKFPPIERVLQLEKQQSTVSTNEKRTLPREPPLCCPCFQGMGYGCGDDAGCCCCMLWMSFRRCILRIVDQKAFEWTILALIFASSVVLCFEDVYLSEKVYLQMVLKNLNLVFTSCFVLEVLFKWLAYGVTVYFSSFWTTMDFVIVCVSVVSVVVETSGSGLYALRAIRTLRALRPLRAISRWQGMKIVVNALVSAIPSIVNVLLVCLVFWLILSIMGVQFFAGKFYRCVDGFGRTLTANITPDMDRCLALNYTWINPDINFDNVGNAYLALFQVATFEGWMEVMEHATDTTAVGQQPYPEANFTAYVYFVIFIICGSFFTLNLFIGVIIDNFNMLKKKYEGGIVEMFLTDSQKTYYTAMLKLGKKKPQRIVTRPHSRYLRLFYDLAVSRKFELFVFLLIFLNMIAMTVEHYQQPQQVTAVLEFLNVAFTAIFGVEALVKIVGLRHYYFTFPWNVFDLLVLVTSVIGIIFEEALQKLVISPTLLRVIRMVRIGRVLRLIKAAKGIRKLLFALIISLPALFNIGALLFLVTFVYAIIGMSLFGHIRVGRGASGGGLNEMVNFKTFASSMALLFRLSTSAGWNDVLTSLMVRPPECDPDYLSLPNGDCGNPMTAVLYIVSYIIINYMVIINMYIAVILENLSQANKEDTGITEEDIEMFYVCWSQFDPHATQFILYSQLSDFVHSLDPPLRIEKPNQPALVAMNLPISRGDKIHCLDILHSLVSHVLGDVEDTKEFRVVQQQVDQRFRKTFPTRNLVEIISTTLKRKQTDNAARVIQKSFRKHLERSRATHKEQFRT